MKVILAILSFFFSATLSWGSESLFSFLRDHKIGSKVSAGEVGINELPALTFSGHPFSAYRELGEDKSIRSAGLYLRSNTSDVSVAELQGVWAEMTSVVSTECGEAEMFEVPNFEDATERAHSMRAWKDENSILVLQKIESPGRIEIDVRHVELSHFISNLGADFGGFVLSKLETKSGKLAAFIAAEDPKPAPIAPQSNVLPPAPPPIVSEVVQPYAKTPMLGLADPRWKEYRAKRKVDPASEWRTPIEFFGKVIDEQDQPVASALIEISWSGTVEKYGGDGGSRRTLTSDANGLFTLTGEEGKRIIVLVSKEGYFRRKSWNNGGFEYGGFWLEEFIEPDRNNPVVFHLVKRPVAEPTLRVRQRSLPKPPEWRTRIDLLAKPAEVSDGGDLVLEISRPSNPGYQELFDYELKIEGQSGAEIILTEEEFMFQAPAKGYEKTITKKYEGVHGNASQTIKFYVHNETRKFYAAVTLEITPWYPIGITKEEDTACYIVTATVNPNHSPNVEYDPEKNIREMEERNAQ